MHTDTMEPEWAAAIHIMFPAQVAWLMLECAKPETETVTLQVGIGRDAKLFEIPAMRLLPVLEADIERRQDKASRQVGEGT